MRSSRYAAPLAMLALALPAATAQAEVGAPGLGDPYYPNAGNGGYDVASYDLELDYSPKSRVLEGRAMIAATAEVGLDRFNLDLRPQMKPRSVTVDGAAAAAEQTGAQELEITPATPIAAGAQFTVEVAYGGKPKPVKDPDGTTEGWIATKDGAFAPNEPQGSPSWYPCNDHPSDKALFSISLTVPKELQAISNGELLGKETSGNRRTWHWRQAQPMATYLATAAIGHFEITRSDEAPAPSLFAVDPAVMRKTKDAKKKRKPLQRTPNVTRFLAGHFGSYPFSTNGGIVDQVPDFPYALETQTRPIYTSPAERAAHRPRDRPPVVRGLADARELEGDLAQRGLRHLRRVPLGGGARQGERGGDLRPALRDARLRRRSSGTRRPATPAPPRTSSRTRSTTAGR